MKKRKVWKHFRCSECVHLINDGSVWNCPFVTNARMGKREKEDKYRCKEHFTLLEEEKRWHKPYYWEKPVKKYVTLSAKESLEAYRIKVQEEREYCLNCKNPTCYRGCKEFRR